MYFHFVVYMFSTSKQQYEKGASLDI